MAIETKDLSLDELACWHGTDKSSRTHGYTAVYEAHFGSLRQQPVTLLEIGVGKGNSLRMWRDYFPHASIYGVDTQDCPALAGLAVTLLRGSQSDAAFLERVAARTGGCDIIVDDGSHLWSDQLISFRTLFPRVKAGGCYVVEDLHTSYWDAHRSGTERPMDFFLDLVHEINLRGGSGYGVLANDPNYPALAGQLTLYQRTIEQVTFVKSMVLIRKKVISQPEGGAR